MKSITRRTLIQLGLSPNYNGYAAIVEAVDLLAEYPDAKITVIYTMIGKRLNSSYSKVERNIRKSVEVVLNRADIDDLHTIFGCTIRKDGGITNGDFITCLANYVKEVYNNA